MSFIFWGAVTVLRFNVADQISLWSTPLYFKATWYGAFGVLYPTCFKIIVWKPIFDTFPNISKNIVKVERVRLFLSYRMAFIVRRPKIPNIVIIGFQIKWIDAHLVSRCFKVKSDIRAHQKTSSWNFKELYLRGGRDPYLPIQLFFAQRQEKLQSRVGSL